MDGEIRSLSEVLKTNFITEKNWRKTKTMEFLGYFEDQNTPAGSNPSIGGSNDP